MKLRILSISIFFLLAVISGVQVFNLKFSFDFEQFFPEGDDDLAYFQEFIKEFESDDNFLLVAIRRGEGVFEQDFLEKFHALTLKTRDLPHVVESQSLTKFVYPLKTPFAITSIPAIHIDDPSRYEADKNRILNDERFVHNLISEDATTLVIFLKTINSIQLDQAEELMLALNELVNGYDFEAYHYPRACTAEFWGRPYFQKELVDMQKREVLVSALISGVLVMIILFWIFRRPWGIAVSLFSIGLGLLLFMGLLGGTGRELNAMAALYPVLMIIVGTSDVIHIMSKYIDELRKGYPQGKAIITTIKEIGLATLLTSLTTAIGFATLLTSRVRPIRDFGLNAAIGVLVAYVTVIFFTTAVVSFFHSNQIIKLGRAQAFWERLMEGAYHFTRHNQRSIVAAGLITLAVTLFGISLITTNYDIINNLPRGKKITEDFRYFEKALTGFRPLEVAVYAQDGYKATDYEVVTAINEVEQYMRQNSAVQALGSITTAYKSINQMYGANRAEAYKMPETREQFDRYNRLIDKAPQTQLNVLVSKDGTKTRITSRIHDIGADSIKAFGQRLDQFIATNTDSTVVKFKQTGTGLIMDKNSEYVRRSLIQGLGMAILIVSLIMALLFRNWRMLIVSLIPKLFPLLLAGALLG